jgi:hypothetical protein
LGKNFEGSRCRLLRLGLRKGIEKARLFEAAADQGCILLAALGAVEAALEAGGADEATAVVTVGPILGGWNGNPGGRMGGHELMYLLTRLHKPGDTW